MFLPTTKPEMNQLGWSQLDIVLVTGDSYIDSPFIGIAVIGKVLQNAGYRVGIIAQPDYQSEIDICRLGEPKLFWGVTGGCVDSMIANYTAVKKKRKKDDFTPAGINNRRPDRAVIVYSNLIRRYFKSTVPIVLGGIEASLRRIAHYDYWSNQVRKSILFNAKADILVYGMGEKASLAIAKCLREKKDYRHIRGICYISKEKEDDFIALPTFKEVAGNKAAFIKMFHLFYQNNDPLNAKGLFQLHDSRYLIQNPPAFYPNQKELDAIYGLDFERAQHPYYQRQGGVKALETIKFSLTTHRGCYGECNFCAIAVHQGRTVQWRSEQSILKEARLLTQYPDFKGYILDVGGPTANMFGFECAKKLKSGSCRDKHCLYPTVCPTLKTSHTPYISLLKKLRKLPGIKKIFIASGIRHDLLLEDKAAGYNFLEQVVLHHLSGQMKIAPEHTEDIVLKQMGKPGKNSLIQFKTWFDKLNKKAGKPQFLTYYLIAAHPGCKAWHMHQLKKFTQRFLKINPEQVQIFIPLPSTYSGVMYYTEMDPFTRKKLFVEKSLKRKSIQKQIVVAKKQALPER